MEGWEGRLAAFVYEFARADNVEELGQAISSGLREVLPGDLASYTEVDLRRHRALAINDAPVDSRITERFAHLAHQHPLLTRNVGSAQTISDYLTVRQFHALELYHDVYRPLGAEDQIAINLPSPRQGVAIGVALNRSRRTFNDRDRATLDMVRPLIVRAYRRALARGRARELLAQLERGADNGAGVIALAGDGKLDFISDRARQWLRAYFPGTSAGFLSQDLAERLDIARRDSLTQLTIREERGLLDIHLLPARAAEPRLIALRERPANSAAAGLTAREHQIIGRVATGETNQEVATALGLSTRTVENHLRAVYRKLGVGSRSAAVAALRTSGSL
jgi:DNA-binding CsgD family transcriptional regulator